MEFEGILKLRKVKKGIEHSAEFTNAKGNLVNFPVHESARYYNETAKDGDPCKLEVEGSKITRCVVPGKEAQPKQSEKRAPASAQGSDSWQGVGKLPGRADFRPVMGTAPYNFVPYRDYMIAPPPENEERKWSGEIVCSLEALTPLLVSGRQEKSATAAANCKFMSVGGKKIIPGTAIKGMLRSLIEILSYSGLKPVSRKRLFWRIVAEQPYRNNFPENPLGGFLRKKGADYYLLKTEVMPRDADAPKADGYEKVATGGFVRNGKKSKSYFFELPKNDTLGELIDREVAMRLIAQLTPNQEQRWPGGKREERMKKWPGLPVFYRVQDGKVVELGFYRYFRLEYKYSPHDLAWPEGDAETPDIAQTIFGCAGKKSFAGRVSIEPFAVEGREYTPGGVNVVLGGPKPTCLPFYLVQNRKIRVISSGRKNERADMNNYNELNSRLRGRKLYWHKDVTQEELAAARGNGNIKRTSCLHPLASGAKAEFVIHVERLGDTELGCLFEALELRDGCAHKLGMGRSLGFGSVRIAIRAANIVDVRKKYSSLADRLAEQAGRGMGEAKRQELREKFRRYVYDAVRKMDGKAGGYYGFEQISNLYLMLDYKNRPAPAKIAAMTLKQFGGNPLLPSPRQVVDGK